MIQPIRVLMVEDSEDDALLMLRMLKKGGYEPEYRRVETAETMRKVLAAEAWDLILCDYTMPRFDGLSALALLKEAGLDIPFILVSGTIGEEIAVSAMKAGAHDYIMKDRLYRLVPAIQRELQDAAIRRERKRIEQALYASERKFHQIFHNSPVPMAVASLDDGRLLDVNEGFMNLTEFTRDELIGKTSADLGLWNDRDERKRIVETICRGEPIKGRPVTLRKKSGETVPLLFSADAVTIGERPCLLSSAIDITERIMAEEKARDALAFQQQLIDVLPVPVFYKDDQARYLGCNRAFENFFGMKREQIVGRSVHDLSPKDLADIYQEADLSLLQNPGTQLYEAAVRDTDGMVHDVIFHKATFNNVNGSVGGLIGAALDITAMRQAEEELKQSLERFRKSLWATVRAIASVVETRDPYTAGHQRRVADLARVIAAEMGHPVERVEGIQMAGMIHDIGKLSVPAEILSKPSKLSPLEFSLIQVHPGAGYDILKNIEFPWPVADMILQHHERLDGSGYPKGIRGDEILLDARILSVADVVESMASHRPYRPALGIDAALEEINRNQGLLYDAAVTKICLKLFREQKYQLPS